MSQELILVDGYNFIHQVTRFKRVLAQGFEIAREDPCRGYALDLSAEAAHIPLA